VFDERFAKMYVADLGKFAEHPVTAIVVAFMLGGLALSGRFSVSATRVLFVFAWILGVASFHGFPLGEFVGLSIAFTMLVIFLAVWARPEVVPEYFGELIPQRTLLFSRVRSVYPKLEIGDSGTVFHYAGPEGQALFQFWHDDSLVVEIIRGKAKVSTRIRDKQGHIVAEIVRNAWRIAPPPKTWDRNYSRDALEVIDAGGNVVLQVKALQDRAQLQGEWWKDETYGIRLVKSDDPLRPGAFYVQFGPGFRPEQAPKITRMFKYPSNRHFGKVNTP